MKKKVFDNFQDLDSWFCSRDLKRLIPDLKESDCRRVNNREELRGYDKNYLLYEACNSSRSYKIYAQTILELQNYVARYFKDDEIWGSGSRNGRLMRITADMSLKEVLSYIDDEIDVTSKQYIDCAKKTEIVSAKLWRNRALSQFVAAVEMSKKRK